MLLAWQSWPKFIRVLFRFACGNDVANEQVTEGDESWPRAFALSMRSNTLPE